MNTSLHITCSKCGHSRPAIKFGERVFVKREILKWTQAQLAKRARVSQSAVSRIEAGRQPPLDVAISVARALDIKIVTTFVRWKREKR